jgi:hypothetical protein
MKNLPNARSSLQAYFNGPLIHSNFARIHKTLRIAAAMAAGLSDHGWSYDEIAAQPN